MARILHVCASPDFAQYVDRLLPALVGAGHEVHFVSAEGQEPQRLLSAGGVHVHTVPIVRSMAPLADVGALLALTRLMAALRPDLVHAHTPKGGLLGMLAARQNKIPARIYQMHGLRYETTSGARRQLLMNCERIAVRAAHRVICVSPSVRERATLDGVLPAEKAAILQNGSAQGLNLSEFEPDVWIPAATDLANTLGIPMDSPCIVYMGRLAADKGLADLAGAWRQVSSTRAGAHLILAGSVDPTDPADLSAFRTLPRVHLLPYQDDPRPLLTLATVVTLPSYREGLPQTILEAGAMQKPVVATRVTGIVDALWDGESGLLVEPHDPAGLARALDALLCDELVRKRMGSAGRNFVGERFSAEQMVACTLRCYETLRFSGSL